MEYIEPKPVEEKKNSKRNKIIIASISGAVVLGGVIAGYATLINNVFIDFDNVEIFRYSYSYDGSNDHEIIIDSIREDVKLPTKLRIPNKLGGYPVTQIGEDCFSYFTTIEEIIFPDSLKSIGARAFEGCTSLKTFNSPANLTYIGTDAFKDTAWIDNQNEGLVTVGKFLYSYNGLLPTDSIIVASADSPEIAKHTGDYINLGDYANVSDGVFQNQTEITYVEFPETFTSINNDLFKGCTSLEKVVLGSKVTSIGLSAFEDCTSLEDINLPSTLETIGERAFSYASLSGKITFPESIEELGAYAFAGNAINEVEFTYNETSGIDRIESGLFDGCKNLATVTFDSREYNKNTSHIGSIGAFAFRGTKISKFDVPYNVSSIGRSAFEAAKELESITLFNNTDGSYGNYRGLNDDGSYTWGKSPFYQGVAKIDARAFYAYSTAEDMGTLTKTNSVFNAIILVDENGNKTADNKISLPLTLSNLGSNTEDSYMFTGSNVTNLDLSKDFTVLANDVSDDFKKSTADITYVAPYLCYDLPNLASIDFEGNSSLTRIYRYAFANCVSLVNINIPTTLTMIDAHAFDTCTSLDNVDLSAYNANGINAYLFANCTSLTSFTISPSIVTIDQHAFVNDTNLATVNFLSDEKLSDINAGAFKNCSALTSINLPSSLGRIGEEAFMGCTSLESINLTSVNTLKARAFAETGLKEISLPKTLKTFSEEAFKDSASLTKLVINAESVVKLPTDALSGTSITTDGIYVPADLLEAYQADASYSEYVSILKAIA